MKLEIPIIHTMKYDDKVKCAYTWSMTHIGFNIEHLFQTYEKKKPNIKLWHLCPTHWSMQLRLQVLAFVKICWIHTNLFMTLTAFTTKMCNVLLVRMWLTHINMQMESTGHFTGWWKRKKKHTKRFSIDLKSDRRARQHLTKNTENKKIRYPFELEHPQNG